MIQQFLKLWNFYIFLKILKFLGKNDESTRSELKYTIVEILNRTLVSASSYNGVLFNQFLENGILAT